MGSVNVSNVDVSSSETEIIGSTETNKNGPRTFTVQNGEMQIEATAWGLDDKEVWQIEQTKTINARESDVLVVGPTHAPRVKLTGKTVSSTGQSIVNANLMWSD